MLWGSSFIIIVKPLDAFDKRNLLSTTFHIYPSTTYIPSFAEITALAETKLETFFHTLSLDLQPKIDVELHTNNPDRVVPTDINSPATWSQNHYAWFRVGNVMGGTDAYFQDSTKLDNETRAIDRDIKIEALTKQSKTEKPSDLVNACLQLQHEWWFRRSAGQPGTINVAYGFLASALAELTSGFIYSDDSAWNYDYMPALPTEFDKFYMRPELADQEEYSEWAERCLSGIESDFGGV